MDITKLSNEDLVSQLLTRANQVSILSESNEIMDLREEVVRRLEAAQHRQADGLIVCQNCGGWLKGGECENCNSPLAARR